MTDWVKQWVPDGKIWIWQYTEPDRLRNGWHFAADPAGCRSLRNLLDRMSGGGACHRKIRLAHITEAVLKMPNYGNACTGPFRNLRIEYQPEQADLNLVAGESRLILAVGKHRLRRLASAFERVEVGDGDFAISTSDNKRADKWYFWWPPQ